MEMLSYIGTLWREITGHQWFPHARKGLVMRNFDVFFVVIVNKLLNKQKV